MTKPQVLCILSVILAVVSRASTQTSALALDVSVGKTELTLSGGSKFGSAHRWANAPTTSNAKVATGAMKNGSTSTAMPTMTITPVGVGTATLTATASDSKSSIWKVSVTVTASGAPPAARNLFSVTPYVQHPATNAMTVIFFTTESCAATVKCWQTDGTGETTELKTACVDVSTALGKNPKDSGDSVRNAIQYRHRVRFEGLRTLTDYTYAVEPSGGLAYTNVFRTLPGKDTPVRFIGYCDCETTPDASPTTEWHNRGGQTKYYVSRSVGFASNIVHMISRKPDLITISGDLAAKGGYQKNWDEFWKENAGGLGLGYNDPAGSVPILAAIGNHDLKEKDTIDSSGGGEKPLEKYLTYFEYNSNGVRYAKSDGTDTAETRDTSQLFHRTDLGPVTLIFLDTNKGDNSDYTKETQHYSKRPAMRSPDFHSGTLQYQWFTNNLADAQRNSRFTFVINHHCPYSVGIHNRKQGPNGYDGDYANPGHPDGESARAVRALTETMIRYGVDAWLCGHDEIQEHSQTNGLEVLPDGTTRAHTLNVYDLGSGGDGLRGKKVVDNPLEVFRAYEDDPDEWDGTTLVSGGCHYGFMEVDVTTNRLGKWQCSLTPCYDFINQVGGKAAGFELRRYKDRIIIDEESDAIVYQERHNYQAGHETDADRTFPADYVEYVRPAGAVAAEPVEPPGPETPPPGAFTVTPYLQHPETNAMTIIFFTDSPCTATVTYWSASEGRTVAASATAADGGTAAETATVRSVTATCEQATDLVAVAGKDDVAKWGTQYRHKVRLTGLAAGTAYGYDVALPGEGGIHYANTFKTVPDKNTPVKFVAYSDSETVPPDFVDNSGNDHATADGRMQEWDVLVNGKNVSKTYPVSRSVGFASNLLHMAAWKPDLYLVAGDLAARGGPQILWDEYWKEMAGGLGLGYGDPAGSAPILATIGNHDLYDNDGSGQYSLAYDTSKGGATALGKFKTYFEFPSNGDSQYDQQYFRQDYGPVTLLFIDSNNGTTGSVSPPFSSGSTMYRWLETNLADAQKNARFTFLVQHHCPYSFGKHNASTDGQTAVKIRNAIEGLVKTYGVTAWIGGHEEMQEHSQLPCGTFLPNGRERVVNVFDLGSAGDGLKGARVSGVQNSYNVFRAYEDSPDGTHYGHLQIEVAPSNGTWYCTMVPAYSYFKDGNSPSELRYYRDKVIVKEGGEIVYQEAGSQAEPPSEDEDGVIAVEGATAYDFGDSPTQVVGLTVRGTGDLTLVNCQNLTAGTIDLSGLTGTVTYEYISSSPDKALPSGLDKMIQSQTDQRVRYAFRGTSEANGWNLGSWTQTSQFPVKTHLVLERGTHTWEVDNSGTNQKFGENGTDANPTLLVGSGATLILSAHDLSGYQGGYVAGGVIRVNGGGVLCFKERSKGSYFDFNYRQRFYLEPDALMTFSYAASNRKFSLHGGMSADPAAMQIYVPASAADQTSKPAVIRQTSGGCALMIHGNASNRSPGCAAFVGRNSKLLIDANMTVGEGSANDASALGKYGEGELEIAGTVEKIGIKAFGGVVTLPADGGKFNGYQFTATSDVTYRFPEGWAADVPYTLGSATTVSGAAPAAGAATVYVGSKKLPGATLAYSGKTVTYALSRDFFSIALDLDPAVTPSEITADRVKVKSAQLMDGGIRLTVGIEGVPVGENAQEEYLGQVFGVTGTASLNEEFSVGKVRYGNMTNNKDGTVSFTAEPTVADGVEKPKEFFFKATVTK